MNGLVIALALCLAGGCEKNEIGSSGDGDVDGDSDGDSDGDTDGDTDADADGDADGDGDSDGDTDTVCDEVTSVAENVLVPVDIIIAIDNSGSMDYESNWVQANMNGFSGQIVASGVDAHIVLISATTAQSDNGICVPAPLGSGDCPVDSNPPNYRHVEQPIGSNDALYRVHQTFDQWSDMLRPGSERHFIVMSDDNSDDTAATFVGWMSGHGIDEFRFHSIVASIGPLAAIANSFCLALGVPLTAAAGTVYMELTQLTGGVYGDLCLQDFAGVFDEVATVVSDVEIVCEWEIPEPPEYQTFVADEVNVDFVDGDEVTHAIGWVESAADCDGVEHGWYYDDNDDPTMIHVCPQTCDWMQGEENAQVIIKFGCETIVADPE
jgi:hypothetical protein